jgi:hypothetical protein
MIQRYNNNILVQNSELFIVHESAIYHDEVNVLAVSVETLPDQSMLVTTPVCQKEQIWRSEKPIICILVQGNNISNRMVLRAIQQPEKSQTGKSTTLQEMIVSSLKYQFFPYVYLS